jgi:cell division protein FtsI (penicillin-binding protein 3)/stage V sporulation protein D (sporulation-specific penicillin-binding protein)
MWRDNKKNTRFNNGVKNGNGRLRLVIAGVFLLFGAMIYRLYIVQIDQCDYYTALANGQHEIQSVLRPERGQILMSSSLPGDNSTYVLATNKDFYQIFAVPVDITNPDAVASNLYDFFDADQVAKNVDAQLAKDNQTSLASDLQTIADNNTLTDVQKQQQQAQEQARVAALQTSSDYLQLAAIKRSQAIENQKSLIINDYKLRLSKPNSQYALLERKVSEDSLLNFYAFMLNAQAASSSPTGTVATSTLILPTDLAVRNGSVVKANNFKDIIDLPGFGFETQSSRYYPENQIGAQMLGFVSSGDGDPVGHYGLEEYFNSNLAGKDGYLKGERGAGNSMIVNNREYIKPINGDNLVLTIDRNIEFYACSQLAATVTRLQARRGTVVAMDTNTGAIIAMCSVPSFDPNNYGLVSDYSLFMNPAISDQYEPGSVFKAVTMSAALDQGKVTPDTTYTDPGEVFINGWPKPIRNADYDTKGGHGVVNMTFVLENSLNTGAIFAMRQTGAKTFADYVKNYGFGEKTGIELGSEASGNINSLLRTNIRDIDAATAAFGQGISVTTLQMLSAYQVFANKGVLMKPYLVKEIDHDDGKIETIMPKVERRIISEKTASTVLGMLANVVQNGQSKKATVPGYYIGGKTGTAQIAVNGKYVLGRYNHTFVGIAPIDNPKFVMLTYIDSPKGITYAEGSALPLWTNIATFMLQYYQVPKDRTN